MLPPPDPPRIGGSSHHSVHVEWLHPVSVGGVSRTNRPLYCLQVAGSDPAGGDHSWTQVYRGYGLSAEVGDLQERTNYQFRLRVIHREEESEWSGPVHVLTQKEPESGRALHKAISRKDEDAVLEMIGSAGRQIVESPDRDGITPLMRAAEFGCAGIVSCLLDHGANVNAQDVFFKRTALMLACGGQHTEAVRQLLARRPEDLADKTDCTALMWAVDAGSRDIVQLLMSGGAASVGARDHVGRTALHHAAAHDRPLVVPLLASAGAALDARDHAGLTPLMLAAVGNYRYVTEALIDCGADYSSEVQGGNTALDIAKCLQNKSFIRCWEMKLEERNARHTGAGDANNA